MFLKVLGFQDHYIENNYTVLRNLMISSSLIHEKSQVSYLLSVYVHFLIDNETVNNQ